MSTEHWFIVSIDSKEMIYGPSLEERNIAFYTDDPVHIYLLEDYVWHDVLVNRLVRRSQDDLQQWITAEKVFLYGEMRNIFKSKPKDLRIKPNNFSVQK